MGDIFLNNVDFAKNQALNLILQIIAGDHGSPEPGMIWYDSSAQAIKFRKNGTTGVLGESSGGNAETLDGQDGTFYLDRANHTGTQLANTISNLATAVQAYRLNQFAAPDGALSMNTQRITNLGNASGNGDAVNYGQLLGAIAGFASQAYVDSRVAALVDSAPGVLDTLNELAEALGDDPNFAATVNAAIAARARKFSATYGDGTATNIVVTHNFGSRDVAVEVYDNSAPYARVSPGVRHTDANTITLVHSRAPTANQYRAVVIGG